MKRHTPKWHIPWVATIVLASSSIMVMNGQVYSQSVFWIWVCAILIAVLSAHGVANRSLRKIWITDIVLIGLAALIIWDRASNLTEAYEYQQRFNKVGAGLRDRAKSNQAESTAAGDTAPADR